MPKKGTYINEQINQVQHHVQQSQNLQAHRGTLSYENLSSMPSGGANTATPSSSSFQSFHPLGAQENSHPNNALTAAQQIPAGSQQLTSVSVYQKSNLAQTYQHIRSDSNHHGSFGNVSSGVGGGRASMAASSGVLSSSTTSLEEHPNIVAYPGGPRNVNGNNSINNEQPPTGDPLPEGWDMGRDYDGKIYFIDHRSQTTTWVDPRERYAAMHVSWRFLYYYFITRTQFLFYSA